MLFGLFWRVPVAKKATSPASWTRQCANGKSHVSAQCVRACVLEVRKIQNKGSIVLDDGWRIVGEYKNKLSSSGQPGVGDAFLKWVLTNLNNPARCRQVRLTQDCADPNHFQEFPSHRGLRNFDPSDKKFVAVSAAHQDRPPILQAADSKWWGWKNALQEAGITVHFLCPEEIREKYDQKMAGSDTA